uniref:J domain-containing protein n=1 Tax=Fagus sylvatica TaxID=28930 RepID=A0A2N9HSU1_FAGSY
MTDLLLDYAKEKWIDGKFKEAYDLASTAKELDPYFLNVNNLCAAYRVDYVVETKKNKVGQTDLYAILGLNPYDTSLTIDTINSTYCKLVKLVHPQVLSSPVAEGALRFITIAWETLTNESTKETYDVRNGLRLPRNIKRLAHQTGTDQRDQVIRVGMKRCRPMEDSSWMICAKC